MAYGRYDSWGPYVSVGERKDIARKHVQSLAKKGHVCCPITVQGMKIARSFWGKAWCQHMESYRDLENRLARGRRYARNGSVFDLQITPGRVQALVSGSEIYEVTVKFKALSPKLWETIRSRCAGQIASIVELLQGTFSDAVMKVLTDQEAGMFPGSRDFSMACSCPDSADMCKHIAAVIYGIGARLDHEPALLFKLRDVDHKDLIAAAAAGLVTVTASATGSGIAELDIADVFGVDIAPGDTPVATPPPVVTSKGRAKAKVEKPAEAKPKAKAGAKAKVKVKPKKKASPPQAQAKLPRAAR